jgi:4a-hydroxytetrahydrobiopterin dehydratase
MRFLIPGPVSTKSWAEDLSETVIVYLPGASLETFLPAFFTVIVIPGPVTAASFVAVGPAGAASGMASATAAASGRKCFFNFSSFVDWARLEFYVSDTPFGWDEVDGALEREFRFADFAEALAFVNRVGALAEEADHHPDIEIHWNRVRLRWWTHVTNSITDRDRAMAEQVSDLV